MAIINADKFISGGSSSVGYWDEVFANTTLTLSQATHSSVGQKINVTGQGVLGVSAYTSQTLNITLVVDGITLTDSFANIAGVFSRASEVITGNSTSLVTIPFRESISLTINSGSGSLITTLVV